MQNRFIYTFPLLVLATVVFLGNSNGRATATNTGNTGAPGDATQPNGTPITCAGCHNAGQFSPTLNIQLIDAQGQILNGYTPGADYTVRVTIPHAGAPKGFGFQMVALRNAGNTNIGTFSDVGTNNYKLKTIASSGRNYAEHAGVSPTNTFDVAWKAPASGAGAVTFYAAGNAVNLNNNDSGDGSANSKLTVQEGFSVATQSPDAEKMNLQVLPNPIVSQTSLSANILEAGNYQITVYDASGRTFANQTQYFQVGQQSILLDCQHWKSGIYFVLLQGNGWVATNKVLKI